MHKTKSPKPEPKPGKSTSKPKPTRQHPASLAAIKQGADDETDMRWRC